LTKYGWPQVVILPALILIAMAGWLILGPPLVGLLPTWAILVVEIILAILIIYTLSFFRDPYRIPPIDKKNILSPADGKITDIESVEENNFIGGPSIKFGIFLSIFNAHINRAPCDVKVQKIIYKEGKYLNAANPQAGQVNESNNLNLIRTENPKDKLVVRQISGAIARRIVCDATEEQFLNCGEKFGMIKFGSRTEIYLTAQSNIKLLVKKGDKVKAGVTILARYE